MKRFILIIIFLLSVSSVISQTFGGGFFGGLSASQLDGDNWGGYHKAGITFGAFTNTTLNQYIDAQLEVRYVQKGSNSNSKENEVFYVSKLNYVEIPLFLKYNFLNKFSANIGLTAGYLQKATEDKDGIGDLPADPEFNTFELSGLVGLTYRFHTHFHFDIRFNYSILPIRSHPGNQTYYLNQGQYNNALTFAVYYEIINSDARNR